MILFQELFAKSFVKLAKNLDKVCFFKFKTELRIVANQINVLFIGKIVENVWIELELSVDLNFSR